MANTVRTIPGWATENISDFSRGHARFGLKMFFYSPMRRETKKFFKRHLNKKNRRKNVETEVT